MSSLITSAATWVNDNQPKKRVSAIRKTIKKKNNDSADEEENTLKTMENLQNIANERSSRVNELLNEMDEHNGATSEDKLSEFEPIEPPIIQTKKDMQSVEYSNDYNPSVSSYLDATLARKTRPSEKDYNYNANDTANKDLSNYTKSYEQTNLNYKKPYYANMGLGGKDDKLMERINYMIHLLEAQQHEKTDNITEEFILYTFLGVFIIFVVDAVSKNGKYTR